MKKSLVEQNFEQSFNSFFYVKEYDFFTPTSDLVSLKVEHAKIIPLAIRHQHSLRVHPETQKPFIRFIIPICMDRTKKSDIYCPEMFINLLHNLDRHLPETTLMIDIVPTGELSGWNILRNQLLANEEPEDRVNEILAKIKLGSADAAIDAARAAGRNNAEQWTQAIDDELMMLRSKGHIINVKPWAAFIELEIVQKLKHFLLDLYMKEMNFQNEFKTIIYTMILKVKTSLIASKKLLPPKIADRCILQYITEELAFQCYIFIFCNSQYDYHIYEKDNYAPLLTKVVLKHTKQYCAELDCPAQITPTLQLLEFERAKNKPFDPKIEHVKSMASHYSRLYAAREKGEQLSILEQKFRDAATEYLDSALWPHTLHIFSTVKTNELQELSFICKRNRVNNQYRELTTLSNEQKTEINQHLIPRYHGYRFSLSESKVNLNTLSIIKSQDLAPWKLPKKISVCHTQLRVALPVWIEETFMDLRLPDWTETFLGCLCGTYPNESLVIDVILTTDLYKWLIHRNNLLLKAKLDRLSNGEVQSLIAGRTPSSSHYLNQVNDYIVKKKMAIHASINTIISRLNRIGHKITMKEFSDIVINNEFITLKNNLLALYSENKEFKKKFKTISQKILLRLNSPMLVKDGAQPEITKLYNFKFIIEQLAMQIYIAAFFSKKYDYLFHSKHDKEIVILTALAMNYKAELFKGIELSVQPIKFIGCQLPYELNIDISSNSRKVSKKPVDTCYGLMKHQILFYPKLEEFITTRQANGTVEDTHRETLFMKKFHECNTAFLNLTEELSQSSDRDNASSVYLTDFL